jgi:hypothetical protein
MQSLLARYEGKIADMEISLDSAHSDSQHGRDNSTPTLIASAIRHALHRHNERHAADRVPSAVMQTAAAPERMLRGGWAPRLSAGEAGANAAAPAASATDVVSKAHCLSQTTAHMPCASRGAVAAVAQAVALSVENAEGSAS